MIDFKAFSLNIQCTKAGSQEEQLLNLYHHSGLPSWASTSGWSKSVRVSGSHFGVGGADLRN